MPNEFRYDRYTSPYVGSIADLMRAPGEIYARAARTSADAEANAQLLRGQAWGNAISGIGQAFANLPVQMAAQKRLDVQTQTQQLALDEAKRNARSLAVFETELKNPANYKPDGTLDDDKVTEALRRQDLGAWEHWSTISRANQTNQLNTRKLLGEIAALDQSTADKAQQQQHVRVRYLGELAYHGEQDLLQNPGDRLHARDAVLATVARAAADGQITEQQAKQFLMQTASASPDELRQVFGSFIPPDLRQTLDSQAAETAAKRATTEKTLAETKNLQTYGRPTAPEPSAAYKEWQDYVTEARRTGQTPLDFNAYMNMDANRKRPVSITNQANSDAAIDQAAKNLIANPRDLTQLRFIVGMRGEDRLRLYNKLKELDPTYDPGLIDRRVKFLDNYENPTGRAATNRQSMNNILMHAADLSAVNEDYRRTNARLLNIPINALQRQYSTDWTRFQTPLAVLKDEIGLYFAGGYAPTADQQATWNNIADGSSTPAQIEQFAKDIIHVGLRRATTANSDFKAMMGYDDPNLLIPEAVAAGQRLGLGAEVQQFGSGGQYGGGRGGPPKEGDTQPIPGYPGKEQTFHKGKWIRTK